MEESMGQIPAAALRDQFCKFISEGKWGSWYILDLTDEEVEEEWGKGKLEDMIRKRMTEDEEKLAEEVHQLRYDGSLSLFVDFIAGYRNRLVGLGCTAEEMARALNFIDQFTEHSH